MASKRNVRRKIEACKERRCEGKIAYETKEAAYAARYYINKKYSDRMTAYPCKFCKKWHLGHPKTLVPTFLRHTNYAVP